MIIRIPVKPFVKKYLKTRYGDTHTISKSSFLGFLIYDRLNKDFDPKCDYKGMDDIYEVELTNWMFKNQGHTISKQHLNALGHALYLLFREDCFAYVDSERLNFGTATRALKEFLNKYNIREDDLKFESIYRDYKRKKKQVLTLRDKY